MNKENSDTYSVTCRCPRLLIFVLVAALVFGAVCVGGVSGANWIDSANTGWYNPDKNEFTIYTAAELAGLAKLVNGGNSFADKTINLGADIDLNSNYDLLNVFAGENYNSEPNDIIFWTPIGTTAAPFKGTFNGGGHLIDDLAIKYRSNSYVGLFGYVESGTILSLNLGFNVFLLGDNGNKATIGSLIGWLHNGLVQDCSVLDGVMVETQAQGGSSIGGLVGTITKQNGDNKNVIGENEIRNYLKGDCSVHVLDTDYKKEWGLIIGSPVIGALKENGGTGGTADKLTAEYTVDTYLMDSNGDYPTTPTTDTYVALVGQTVTVPIPDGYAVHDNFFLGNVLSGTVDKEGKLKLRVYLKILPVFTIEIPSDFVIDGDTFVGAMSINVDIDKIATKLGTISIRVRSTNGFKLVLENHQDTTLPYNLFKGNSATPLIQDAEIGSYTSVQDTSVVLNAVTQNPPYSGTYGDTLTFTIQYSEAA